MVNPSAASSEGTAADHRVEKVAAWDLMTRAHIALLSSRAFGMRRRWDARGLSTIEGTRQLAGLPFLAMWLWMGYAGDLWALRRHGRLVAGMTIGSPTRPHLGAPLTVLTLLVAAILLDKPVLTPAALAFAGILVSSAILGLADILIGEVRRVRHADAAGEARPSRGSWLKKAKVYAAQVLGDHRPRILEAANLVGERGSGSITFFMQVADRYRLKHVVAINAANSDLANAYGRFPDARPVPGTPLLLVLPKRSQPAVALRTNPSQRADLPEDLQELVALAASLGYGRGGEHGCHVDGDALREILRAQRSGQLPECESACDDLPASRGDRRTPSGQDAAQ